MNFSTKVRYGTRAMVDIARLAGVGGGVTISAVAESQDISQKYLESLLVRLRKSGLLKSQRGKKGGYSLNREVWEITVYDIVEALEGPLNLVDCTPRGESCDRAAHCDTKGLWQHLTEGLRDQMKEVTLETLVEGKNFKEEKNG